MSAASETKRSAPADASVRPRHVTDCQLEGDRLSVTMWLNDLTVVWWQRRCDFEPNGQRWEEQAAASYSNCACALLAGSITHNDVPNISAGNLSIKVADGTARVRITYYDYGGDSSRPMRARTDAAYEFDISATRLAAVFSMASLAILHRVHSADGQRAPSGDQRVEGSAAMQA